MTQRIIDNSTFETVRLDPANPAVNTDYTFIVPANTVIQPIGITFILTTSAVVANRRVRIRGSSAAIPWAQVMSSTDHVASLAMYYYWILGNIQPFYSAPMNQAQFPLFDQIFLYPTNRLLIGNFNTQAGDQISDIHIGYKRWILA